MLPAKRVKHRLESASSSKLVKCLRQLRCKMKIHVKRPWLQHWHESKPRKRRRHKTLKAWRKL
ncbi:hypothetical protein D3C80_1970930 [compost metagenome]